MKTILMCLTMVALVPVAFAKTKNKTDRTPAQVSKPASISCKLSINGGGGQVVDVPVNQSGSEAGGDLKGDVKATTGTNNEFSYRADITQVSGMYIFALQLEDSVSGVKTIQQQFIDFPQTMMSTGASATLIFSKNKSLVKADGKDVTVNSLQFTCSLVRK